MDIKNLYFFLALLFFSLFSFKAETKCISPLALVPNDPTQKSIDLFDSYEKEVKAIKAQLSKNLNQAKQASEISQALKNKNQEDLQIFLKNHSTIDVKKTDGRVNLQTANLIFNSMLNHPVVGLNATKKYEHHLQDVGFCFGRAAYVHFELIKAGVDVKNIIKVFALGGLYRNEVGWDYHVATAALSDLGIWLVIDSLNDEVMELQNWIKKVSTWDGNKLAPRLRYFITSPNQFQPNGELYSSQNFNHPAYKGYFKDLLNWYSKKENCIRTDFK